MGLFNRKDADEGAGRDGQVKGFEDGKVPWAADRDSIGQPVQGQTQGADFSGMAAMGAQELIEQMQRAQASVAMDIAQDPQAIADSNTETGERLKDVMRKYGIDPETGATNINPSQMMAMQQEMMQVISGADPAQGGGAAGAAEPPKFDIQMSEPTDSDDTGS